MVYRGRVENGVIVLDETVTLPNGTEVSVQALSSKSKDGRKPARKPAVGKALLRLAGKAVGLPPDVSRNVDHYLYGHAKK